MTGNSLQISILSGRTLTFAFHIADWKRPLFVRYFPDREFVFPEMHIGEDEINKYWAEQMLASTNSEIFIWSKQASAGLVALAEAHGIPMYILEDGFIRSTKANASRTAPLSLTLDRRTAHFDSNSPSDLETLLNTYNFPADPTLMERSRAGIRVLLERGVSKYNSCVETDMAAFYGPKICKRVLVIGQVEDDASVRYGCAAEITNNDLVKIAAAENPEANIFYKPHPDILNRVRLARSQPRDVQHLCTVLSAPLSIAQALETIDHVYTITSLAGFEALLRNIKVTTIGCPFYSGWGLTDDRQPNSRRRRKLSIQELFAGAYLLYPHYFDPNTGASETFETTVQRVSDHFSETNQSVCDIAPPVGPLWRLYGPYGVLGWRHLLSPVLTLIVRRIGTVYDVQDFRKDPIKFFRNLRDPKFRRIGRILYPFDN